MTEKKHIGLFVGASVCAALIALNPAAAWASGDVGPAPAPAPGNHSPGSPAGAIPERPVPAPERIVPASPPGVGGFCPTL
ncbi:hypothetical protein IU474_04640 [Nocardia otitidiscaviarum]|uniref:hypothetical protein n=1 Tax=Nocardia otitidiscaviarum TaxID=1823 RepID=UPI001893A9F5|nr:hypothetical protein [Nocardia otitidiscaviarum]MBF6236367.1 hypothetical protein [Nocardia otitidiscaviarum]